MHKHKSSQKKKRVNVGVVASVREADMVKSLLDRWGHQVFHYDEAKDDFVPHKVSDVLAPANSPGVSTTGYEFEDALCEAFDLFMGKCQEVCEQVAVNLHSTLEGLTESMFLTDSAAVTETAATRKDARSLTTEDATFNSADTYIVQEVFSVTHSEDETSLENNESTTEESLMPDESLQPKSFFAETDWEPLDVEPDLSPEGTKASAPLVVVKDKKCLEEAYVLLISSRSDPRKLILPKGGLHAGESACCGALRECWEESGVTGSCEASIKMTQEDFHEVYYSRTRTSASGGGLPERDAKHRRISKWYWFSMKANKICEEWPEKSQRRRLWVQVKDLPKLKNLREDARFVLDCWLESTDYL